MENRTIFIKPQGGIGDLFVAIPLLHALGRAMPGTEIVVGLTPAQVPLGELLMGCAIDRAVPLPYERRLSTLLSLRRAIAASRAHLVVDLMVGSYLPVSGLRRRPRVIGCVREDVAGLLRWLPRDRPPAGASKHRVDRYLQVVSHLGCPKPRIDFDIPRDLTVLESMRSRLAQHEMLGPGVVAVVPQSGILAKSWPAENLQRTIDAMVHDLDLRVVLVGGLARSKIASSTAVLDLRGHTTLQEAIHLLRYSGAFETIVGVDTGLMQLAGSLNSDAEGGYETVTFGNRTVSLFGATDPDRDRPYDPTGRGFNLVVRAPQDGGRPTRREIAVDRLRRMSRITPEMVLANVEQHVSSARGRVARRMER